MFSSALLYESCYPLIVKFDTVINITSLHLLKIRSFLQISAWYLLQFNATLQLAHLKGTVPSMARCRQITSELAIIQKLIYVML